MKKAERASSPPTLVQLMPSSFMESCSSEPFPLVEVDPRQEEQSQTGGDRELHLVHICCGLVSEDLSVRFLPTYQSFPSRFEIHLRLVDERPRKAVPSSGNNIIGVFHHPHNNSLFLGEAGSEGNRRTSKSIHKIVDADALMRKSLQIWSNESRINLFPFPFLSLNSVLSSMALAKYYRESKDKSSGQDIHRPMKSELKEEVKKLRELVRR